MKRFVIFLLWSLAIPFGSCLPLLASDLLTLRERFLEIARLQEVCKGKIYYLSDSHDKDLIRQANDADRTLLNEPTDLVFSAVSESLREGATQEVAGALHAYGYIISMKHLIPDPGYKPLLLAMLAKDDFTSRDYTDAVSGALRLYPSRETMLAWMAAASRVSDEKSRENFILAVAGLLHIQLNYTTNDPTPDRKRRAIAEFEAWYEKNKDKIHFDKKGEPHFHGGPAEWKPPELSSQDKARIKADPVCVLQLFESFQQSEDPKPGEMKELNSRCGLALLGKEGSSMLARMLEQSKDGTQPNLDQQFLMSSAAASYPTVSAALTAVAYVVSAEPVDPKGKELAVQVVDDFGDQLDEILKGEPASVKKKVRELAQQQVP